MIKYLLSALLVIAIFVINSPASACNECHSKKPEMVRMHKALEYKDCFVCHRIGEKKSPEILKDRQMTDQRCNRCHGK